jgi:arsenate reductase
MAEAFANKLGEGRVRAWSAGSAPLGRIIPQTHDVLSEKGISLEGHWSKGLDDVPVNDMDFVVGMGCEINCPVSVGFKGRVVEWDIPDPYGRHRDYFRSVRDLIERQVAALLKDIEESVPAKT